ncbi:hypothetical protein C6P40_004315 [Pichia californica]|uniref:NOT2/NOT3/NOT5 C-terminal domain-containing protein n=1 Tax=Pichia californica TaxID=460514 RepID=A0A9P6WFR3_9ASCO|nr:hypothetical protein C6P42_004076 [[Candida] californica]KAG0686364.1 hypothetical protein C6P40_004315 [[Candida] californica]
MEGFTMTERSGSQQNKLSKNQQQQQQRSELTPEQIQQQNILRLNGFSSSTIHRNGNSNDEDGGDISNENGNFNLKGDGNNSNTSNNESSLKFDKIDENELDDMSKFGLQGLVSLLKHNDNDQNNIAKGIDLNMLGLNLELDNKTHLLSKTLSSPWLETSRSEVEPLFNKPDSFKINGNELLPIEDRMISFNDLTLFFIFYTKPRDILQELSARELNRRNWRYHKELQVWLTKDTNSEPKAVGIGAEEGTYIFFDPVSWEYVTKTLVLYYNSIIQ